MALLKIFQIILALILIAVILLQNRGAGSSGVFGGIGSNVYSSRRGIEKFLFKATIAISALFFLVSLALLFI